MRAGYADAVDKVSLQ